jgi:hypothetical protein
LELQLVVSFQKFIVHALAHALLYTDTICTTPRTLIASHNINKQIGEGSFGKVFMGLNEKTGELFAVKQISLMDGSQDEVC